MITEAERAARRGLKFQMLVAAVFAIVGGTGAVVDGAPLWWLVAIAGAAWLLIAAVRLWYRRD